MKKSLKTAINELLELVAHYESEICKLNEKMLKDIVSSRVNALLLDFKSEKFEFDISTREIDIVKVIVTSPLNKDKETNEKLLELLTQSSLNKF